MWNSRSQHVKQAAWPGPDSRELQLLAGTLSRMGLGILHAIPLHIPESYNYVLREIAHRNALEQQKADTQACEPRSNWKAIEVRHVAEALQLSTKGEFQPANAHSKDLQFLFKEAFNMNGGFRVSSAKDPEFKVILCLIAAVHRRHSSSDRATASLVGLIWNSYRGSRMNWGSIICSWIKASCERVRWGGTSYVLPLLFAIYERQGWLSVNERQWWLATKEKISKCSEQFASPRASLRLEKKRKRVNYKEESDDSSAPSPEELAFSFETAEQSPPSSGDEAVDEFKAPLQDRVQDQREDQRQNGEKEHSPRRVDKSFVVDSHAKSGATVTAEQEQPKEFPRKFPETQPSEGMNTPSGDEQREAPREAQRCPAAVQQDQPGEFRIPQDQPERFAQEQPEERMEKSFVDDVHWQAKYDEAMAQNAQLLCQAQFRGEMYKSMCETLEDWLAQKTVELASVREEQKRTNAEMISLREENKKLTVERTEQRTNAEIISLHEENKKLTVERTEQRTNAEIISLREENSKLTVERTVLREEQTKMGEEMRLLREEHTETKQKLETNNRELCKVQQRITMAHEYLGYVMQEGGGISDKQNEDRLS